MTTINIRYCLQRENDMELKELLPPFYSKDDESYYESLKRKLNFYKDYLGKSMYAEILSNEDIRQVNSVSDRILESINEYLSGKSGDSYKKIESVLNSFENDFGQVEYTLNNQKSLIRIRQSSTNLHERRELFHVPFTKRDNVAKQRYSIEGLPCLYLAACSYTAWLELNKPNFNDLWVSAFRSNVEIPILDLSFTLSKLTRDYNEKIIDEVESKNKLKIFPFVLATSFRVKNPSGYFHEEYIISGNLLQWIVNNTYFKGIRFLSTKLESYDNLEHLWCSANFVIPPVDFKNGEIFSESLRNSFRLTKPQNWSVLLSYTNAGEVTAYAHGVSPFDENTEEISGNENSIASSIDDLIFNRYMHTDFFNIDGYLSSIFKLDFIEENC